MLNTSVHAPSLVAVTQSNTVNEPFSLRGLDIFVAGTVKVTTIDDVDIAVTFPAAAAGGSYPYRWEGQIKRVWDTGTSLTDAQMVGLR